MMHPYTQAIFNKHDRGGVVTQDEVDYLLKCVKPPSGIEWLYVILAQPILGLLVYGIMLCL